MKKISGWQISGIISAGFFAVGVIHWLVSTNSTWLWFVFSVFFGINAVRERVQQLRSRKKNVG